MSESRKLYEELSKEFIRKGIGGDKFSLLEKLYKQACNNELLKPEWDDLNAKTINELEEKLNSAIEVIELYKDQEVSYNIWSHRLYDYKKAVGTNIYAARQWLEENKEICK